MAEFDYQSPITQIVGEMQMEYENHVLKAVQNIGIHVNREELIKALAYDRGQYEKGYADGYTKAIAEFIRKLKTHPHAQYHLDKYLLEDIYEIAEQLKEE